MRIVIAAFLAFLLLATTGLAVPAAPWSECWQTQTCPLDPDQPAFGPAFEKPGQAPAFGAPSTELPNTTLNATGNQKLVVIAVRFSDIANQTNITSLNDSLQQMVGYFQEVSYYNLNLTIDVYGWYTLPQTMAYYGSDTPSTDYNVSRMFSDAITAADAAVNFTQYDHLLVVHADQDEAANTSCTDCIWSARYSWSPYLIQPDGVNITGAATVAEIKSYSSPSFSLGTAAHEVAHDMGALDLYNTLAGTSVVQDWSLMDIGSWLSPPSHIDPWHKLWFKWLNVTSVPYGFSFRAEIAPAAVSDFAAVVLTQGCNMSTFVDWTSDPCQYFIIEWRNATGSDAAIPESGILVWHIDNDRINQTYQYNRLNAYAVRSVMPEDQNSSIANLDGAAYIQGDQNFNATSTPNSSFNNATPTDIAIFNWTDQGTNYSVQLSANDTADPVINITSPSNKSALAGTRNISVNISEIFDSLQLLINGSPAVLSSPKTCTSPPPGQFGPLLCTFPLNTTAYSDGTHYSNATASDGAGNTGWSATLQYQIDNTAPVWATNQSSTPAEYSPIQSEFNISWSDATTDISTVWLEQNWTNPANISISNATYGGAIYTYSAVLPAGTYYWKFWANDSAGNWNSTDTWIFTIAQNSTNPVSLNLNGTSNNRTYTYPEAVSATGAALYTDSGTLYLYRDGVQVASGTASIAENVLLGNGTYAYKINITGNTNYTSNATGITFYAFINKGALTATISAPSVTYPANLSVTATEYNIGDTDVTYEIWCDSYWANDTTFATFDLAAGTYTCKLNSTGGANWTASASIASTTGIISQGPTFARLWLNGTADNRAYLAGDIANLTALINVTGKMISIIANFTGTPLIIASGTGSVTNITNTSNLNISTVYNITANFSGDVNYTGSAVSYFMGVCSPGPLPSDWSACVGGQRTRTVYHCNLSTGYSWISYTETESCVVPTAYGVLPAPTISVTAQAGAASVAISRILRNTVAEVDIEPVPELAIRGISIFAARSTYNAVVGVQTVTRPPQIAVAPHVPYHYLNITTNIAAANIANVTFDFAVPRSWIDDNNIDPDTVVLSRWTAGTWEELPTEKINETAEEILYAATSPGLSYFAISGQRIVVAPPAPPVECPEPVPEPGPWGPCINGTKERRVYECIAGEWIEKTESRACVVLPPPPLPAPPALLLLVAVALGLLVILYFKLRKRHKRR
jgi:immune inhibitor A